MKHALFICMAALLLLTACVTTEVTQKLQRDGNYDLTITFTTTEALAMVLPAIEQGIQVHESVKDNLAMQRSATSVSYVFTDIDPATETELFVQTNVSSHPLLFTDSQHVQFIKHFRFPYMVYNYSVEVLSQPATPPPPPDFDVEAYVVDEANILSDQDVSLLAGRVQRVYDNESVGMAIITKSVMSLQDFTSYKTTFAQDFLAEGDASNYILLFSAQNNATPFCRLETNLLFDGQLPLELAQIGQGFQQNCSRGIRTSILDASARIDDLAVRVDFGVEQPPQNSMGVDILQQQLAQLSSVIYNVEVFGNVVETNGLKQDDRLVRFNVNTQQNQQLTVIFQEFFLATVFGDHYLAYVSGAAFLVLILLILLVFRRVQSYMQSPTPTAPIGNLNPKIMAYVRRGRSCGISDADLRARLIASGWDAKQVDACLRK